MSTTTSTPLKVSATALTTATPPTAGQITRYNATSGALAPTLPALSGLNVGALFGAQKDESDTSANIVTVTCGGSDTFDSGSTTSTLKLKGSLKIYQVVLVSATKMWKVIGAHDSLAALDLRYAPITAGGAVENVNTVTTSGSAQTIPDVTTATMNRIVLTANCAFTFPTAAAGKSFSILLVQDATGSRTATWPGAIKWNAGTAPVLTTTAAKADEVVFRCYDGTSWVGSITSQGI